MLFKNEAQKKAVQETRELVTCLQASPRSCIALKITVLRARNVTQGWYDWIDTPDPYLMMRIPSSAEIVKRTKCVSDNKNPEWNEEPFVFHIDPEEHNVLELTLWDQDLNEDDQIGDPVFLLFKNLQLDKPEERTLKFGEFSEVDIILEAKKVFEHDSDLRYSTDLCDEEKQFRDNRKKVVFEAMKKVLGERAPQNIDEVPTIAVLGSGGGYRATTGFTAACTALEDLGLLDCVTYLTGLSGSAWGLSLLYSQTSGSTVKPKETQSNIREQLQWGPFWLLTPRRVMHYVKDITEKWKRGQPVSLTDFYGHCVGESLLGQKKDSVKLSHQQEKVGSGHVPMPIYTAINSRRDVSAESFAEWVEFTPYEIGMDKYGTFMKTELFGSKFFCGKLIEKFPESPLYYLQGIWGSFYAILLQRVMKEEKKLREILDNGNEKQLLEQQFLSDNNEINSEHDEDDGDDLEHFKRRKNEEVPDSLMENLKTAVAADEETYEINGKSSKNQRAEKKEFRRKLLQYVMEKLPGLQTRTRRAGLVHNFLRGLGLNTPQVTDGAPSQTCLESDNIKRKQMELIDAGLMFNSPYPPLLRKERSVDLILSFDFSARETDEERPFKNIKLAEDWAKRNGLLFPPIDADEQYERDGIKECYVFKHPTDPACPIVLHFVLINKTYRDFIRPGVPRTANEERKAGDFPVFNDPKKRYSTFNLKYSHDIFDRLSGLVEFNTSLNEQLVKNTMAECVQQKRRRVQLKN
ncbi:cytosolic phospholipase A2-like [Montipora capricornis]|uniref:cytosolic phospholipase A2-like n=1 Tax=Montipora capricornis TaxID=246305 RepID=UPI0035F207D7